MTDDSGKTLWHEAAEADNTDVGIFLLQHGLPLRSDRLDVAGLHPVHVAASMGHLVRTVYDRMIGLALFVFTGP